MICIPHPRQKKRKEINTTLILKLDQLLLNII